jgi:hypothetical protein
VNIADADGGARTTRSWKVFPVRRRNFYCSSTGPGAAYFLALLPLLVLALTGWMLAGALQSRRGPQAGA